MSRPESRPRRRRAGKKATGFARLTPEQIQARAASVPPLSYPAGLPVVERKGDLLEAIAQHQVVIVAGETGSGKTTQLPKLCLELGRGVQARIGHTQPRRIAARSVAERLCEELDVELGAQVGYQVRFTDHSSARTLIKVMTDGILLAEIQRDRLLRAYDTLIIDEAHERSLTIDFLLGYLKQLLPQRPDLKVIITSATIDPERFAAHFADGAGRPAPIVEVSGRGYPVEVRYRPLLGPATDDLDGDPLMRDQTEAVVDAVEELLGRGTTGSGDILVFLPGEREIRDTQEALEPLARRRNLEIVPLYGRLSAQEQHRVFAPHPRRRVVLSTNVAETSLTVPGIVSVVDTGLARVSRFSVRSKVQRLPIEPISQASALQRSGRCGRTEPGVAIRLYDEADFLARPAFTEPEILRTNLASVILQMKALGLGEVQRFPFIDPPDRRAVSAGVQLLRELGAVRGAEAQLTDDGRRLARLPLDPRLGRMVLEAGRRDCLGHVLPIVAALAIQDPRERPLEQASAADAKHARFVDRSSDFLTLWNLWRYVSQAQKELSSSAFRRMCRDDFLNYLRIREWQELTSQLRQLAREERLELGRGTDLDPAAVHQSLLAGLLSHLGSRQEQTKEYAGSRGSRFAIFPGSGVARRPPDLVMAAELVETSRLFARTVAAIEPGWVEQVAGDLVTRSYSEPHWSRRRGAAMAYEKVSLFGVPLVADRLVNYAKVDPALARELFIRHALVYGEWSTRHRFFHDNQASLSEAETLEHRARRRGLVADEHTLFDFYDARVGPEVVSAAHFDSWWKKVRQRRPDLLRFQPDLVVTAAADEVDRSEFPDLWHEEGLTFSLSYHFEPGAVDDGVCIEVPLATFNQLQPEMFSWQVPGLREELVVALLKSLPKQLRVHFVPAPNTAKRFLAEVTPGSEALVDALARYLRAQTGVHVPAEAWDWSRVPAHLQPHFRIIGANGETLAQGRDFDSLALPLAPTFERQLDQATQSLRRDGMRSWDVEELPMTFQQVQAGHQVVAYPGLADQEDGVAVRIFSQPAQRDAAHRAGVARLLRLALPTVEAGLARELSTAQKLALAASPYQHTKAMLEDLTLASIDQLLGDGPVPWNKAAFDEALARIGPELQTTTASNLELLIRVLGQWRLTEKALSGRVEPRELAAMAQMQAQLATLMGPGFLRLAGREVAQYPRYLEALVSRREGLREDPLRDARLAAAVEPLAQEVRQRIAALPPVEGCLPAIPQALRQIGVMVEELRVSLWAQRLGTPQPVSEKRIRHALAQLG